MFEYLSRIVYASVMSTEGRGKSTRTVPSSSLQGILRCQHVLGVHPQISSIGLMLCNLSLLQVLNFFFPLGRCV
jgi:hypothetical protein